MNGRVVSVNLSAQKGMLKRPVPQALITDQGFEGDAHAGPGHRQVSLLSAESITAFAQSSGRERAPGDFAENLTVSHLNLAAISPRTRLRIGAAVELEVTQLGKRCHGNDCAIMREVGACIMPKEGIFCRVIRGGMVKAGDPVEITSTVLNAVIITVSDRASRGEYADKSGPELRHRLERHAESTGQQLACQTIIVPDDVELIRAALQRSASAECQVVFTTGGTGIGPRDVTPEAVRPLLEKELPGIMEHIRVKHAQRLPAAMLSRSLAGVAGQTLVFCVPGSVRAVNEYLDDILPLLDHALRMIKGSNLHD
ncbi:MAG: molybdenum cofactor synthesis domain-containing protein [Planctomycetota bacterium]